MLIASALLCCTTVAHAAGTPVTAPATVPPTPHPATAPRSAPSDGALSGVTPMGAVTLTSLGQGTQTLSGTNPFVDLYIPSPDGVTFGNNSVLHVVYSRSPLLDPRLSAISIFVNNVNVAGQSMAGDKALRVALNIHIPGSALLKSGVNHLQISFLLAEQNVQAGCGVLSPYLNVTLFGNSWFHYDAHSISKEFQPDLAALPAPFSSQVSPNRGPLGVSLPVAPTVGELSAMGWVLARFGLDLPLAPPRPTVLPVANIATAARNTNVLLVGTPRDNPVLMRPAFGPTVTLPYGFWRDANGLWRGANGRELPATEGILLETRSPWNAQRAVLIVSGNGQTGIRRAAEILASATLRRLLHGAFATVPMQPALPRAIVTPVGTVSLAALGYSTVTLEGTGEHVARYTFDIRRTASVPGEFDLIYGHSGALDPAASTVRVDLNNQPLGSRTLNHSDGPQVLWRIPLAPGELQLGTNTIAVRMFLPEPFSCTQSPGASIWGRVDSASTLFLPPGPLNGHANLSLLPFPIVEDGSPDDAVVVAPAAPGYLQSALRLAALIGAQCRVDAPRPTIMTVDEATPARLRGHTVILMGEPASNPLVAYVDPRAPLSAFPLQLTGNAQALRATLHEQGGVGVVEEFPSPWDTGHSVLLISATAPALLPAARELLLAGGLGGTVATIDTRRRVQTFDTSANFLNVTGVTPRPIRTMALLGLLALILLAGATVLQRYRSGDRTA